MTMKTMRRYKHLIRRNNDDGRKAKSGTNRFLITINVFGSAGPLKFVVNGEDTAGEVVDAALKIYMREGRLPILRADANSFFLYPIGADGIKALEPWEVIEARKTRKFGMHQKQTTEGKSQQESEGKGSGWRSWLRKYLSPKIIIPHWHSFIFA